MLEQFSNGKIDSGLMRLASVYHSMPVDIFTDDGYQKLLADKFGGGPGVAPPKHVIDDQEVNLPVISKAKSLYFTERLKMICPLMFPTNHGLPFKIKECIQESHQKALANFEIAKNKL